MRIKSEKMDVIRHMEKQLRAEVNAVIANPAIDDLQTARIVGEKLAKMAALFASASAGYQAYAAKGGWESLDEVLNKF